jgi:hypothetical protein
MYKIIGADGREYGPVTAEQLSQWIREGRANAQTKAQSEGSAEWKSLGEFAEFADALRAAAAGPAVPPVAGAVDPQALAAQILARDYRIEIGQCISRGWELVKNDFWLLVGASVVAGLIVCCVGIFVTSAIAEGALMYAYEGIFGSSTTAQAV